MKKNYLIGALLTVILFSAHHFLNAENSKDLTASLANIPGLADSAEKGAFVDLVKAMDKIYTDGRIKIEVYPFARSMNNVAEGRADFHIPIPRDPDSRQNSDLPYRIINEKIGSLAEVIFSNSKKPVTKAILENEIKKGKGFTLKVEGSSAMSKLVSFPVIVTNSIDQSLKKVDSGRIDALIWAQEESDITLKNLKLKQIHRELWKYLDDSIIVQKGPKGDATDRILSDLLRKLKSSGELNKIYSRIHRPYTNWQPADMGW